MIILLVEDEYLLGLLLAEALTAAGHRVLGPAARVDEALAAASATKADLAPVDVELRAGGSGIDVARTLLRRWGVPTLFASGRTDRGREPTERSPSGFWPSPTRSKWPSTPSAMWDALQAGRTEARSPQGLEVFEHRAAIRRVRRRSRGTGTYGDLIRGAGAIGAIVGAAMNVTSEPPSASRALK
jgi:CheY-like chemotaxis protein